MAKRGGQFALVFWGVFMLAVGAGARVTIPSDDKVPVRQGQSSLDAWDPNKVLRLTVWNVHKYDNRKTFGDVQNLTEQSDLMMLQETMMGGLFDRYYDNLAGLAWMAAISFFNSDNLGTGVTTGSRAQASYQGYVRSTAREPFIRTPKMIVVTKYPIQNHSQSLLVANIHGINFVSTNEYETQLGQLELAIKDHSGPMIVAGDFNTHLPGRALLLRSLAERLGLDHVQMENERYNRMILDHIFARGMQKLNSQVLFGVDSSDHYPLRAEFKLAL